MKSNCNNSLILSSSSLSMSKCSNVTCNLETRSRISSKKFSFPFYNSVSPHYESTGHLASIYHRPSSSPKPWRRFLNQAFSYRSFAVLVCYTGALIQTAFLTRIYFEFKTTTMVKIVNPRRADLPAISICFFYRIPDLKLIHIGNNISQSSLTVGEINSRLPSWEDFIQECFVMDKRYQFQKCDSMTSEIAEFISLYSKCFTMFTNLTEAIIYTKELVGSNRLVDFTLNISHSVVKKVGVYLTHPTSELDEALGTPSFVYFDTKSNNRATVSYHKTIINSLPSPYESGCFDYSKLPCGERKTCIKQCTLGKSYNESKGFINRRFIRIRSEVLDGRFGIRNHLDNHTDQCNRMYMQTPCHEFLYQAIMGSEFESPFINSGSYRVSIDYPLGTETNVQYVPKRSFLDYICFAASVLSLWTEISLIRLAEVSSKATINFLSRKLSGRNVKVETRNNHDKDDEIMTMTIVKRGRSDVTAGQDRGIEETNLTQFSYNTQLSPSLHRVKSDFVNCSKKKVSK